MSSPESRATYTDEQLSQYLQLLFGDSHKLSSLSAFRDAMTRDALKTVGILQTRHLAGVPFSTVGFNYASSQIPNLSLTSEDIFQKVVVKKQGGFCLEVNILFSTVLRSIGIENYLAAGRISYVISNTVRGFNRDPKGFDGWQHMLIIATIDGKKYNIDVGFTAFGPTKPIPLEENVIVPVAPGLEARHVRESMVQGVTDQLFWVYQTRNAHNKEWSPGYCFSELENLHQDFDAMNFQLCADPSSWTLHTLLVAKLLLKGDEIEGMITMLNTFVQRRLGGGEAEILEVFKTESDRVNALEKYYGIVLSDEEVKGISGRSTEIKA